MELRGAAGRGVSRVLSRGSPRVPVSTRLPELYLKEGGEGYEKKYIGYGYGAGDPVRGMGLALEAQAAKAPRAPVPWAVRPVKTPAPYAARAFSTLPRRLALISATPMIVPARKTVIGSSMLA